MGVFEDVAELIEGAYGVRAGAAPWRAIFASTPPAMLRAAVLSWIAREPRRPTPADIRASLGGYDVQPPWEAAQETFLRAAFPSGDPDREPRWLDQAIASAVQAMGGWRSILETWQTRDRPTNLAQWREAYKAAWFGQQRAAVRSTAADLLGQPSIGAPGTPRIAQDRSGRPGPTEEPPAVRTRRGAAEGPERG